MASDVFTIQCSALPNDVRVAGFRGSEAISRLYEFDVYILVGASGNDLDLAATVGAKAKLLADRQDGRPPFVFTGIFAQFELLHEFNDRALFRGVLVPLLWQLTQTLHSRIYTKKSIPDIIESIFDDNGFTSDNYALQLSGDYKPEEHVCQYHESDLDFIARWMEREGMYYYFEHGDDGDKLIISDNKSFQDVLHDKPVRFYPLSAHDSSSKEALHTFTCKHQALPATVKLKDYDYAKPSVDLSGVAPVSKEGFGEISLYGERFFTPDDGKRIAKIRAEELLARQVVFKGSGTQFYLRSGYKFELEEHPRTGFDAKYLAVAVEHTGNQALTLPEMRAMTNITTDRVYWVEVTAISERVQFRAERATSWPRVYGYENGTICGPADSTYAQIDDHGRYSVKFKFDESNLKDGKASTWVRMAQPHGGTLEGFHFPLRKGTEVLFTFMGGDPDRPVIAGVVPNTLTPSPVNKSNHTKNVIQTGGLNRFELDDQKGSERITLQTPHTNTMIRMGAPNEDHNLIVRTDGLTLLDAGKDWDVKIGGHLDEDIKGLVKEVYHSTKDETVTSKVTETYSGGQKSTVSGGDRELQVTGGLIEHCTGTATQDYDTSHLLTTGPRTDHVKGALTQTIDAAWTATATGNITIHSSGGTVTIKSPTQITLDAPAVKNKAVGQWFKMTAATIDLYGSKNSAGIQKFDGCGISMGVNGMKMETTGMAMAATGMKMEKVGMALAVTNLKVDLANMKFANKPLDLEIEEIAIFSGAFSSITKAFMKIG